MLVVFVNNSLVLNSIFKWSKSFCYRNILWSKRPLLTTQMGRTHKLRQTSARQSTALRSPTEGRRSGTSCGSSTASPTTPTKSRAFWKPSAALEICGFYRFNWLLFNGMEISLKRRQTDRERSTNAEIQMDRERDRLNYKDRLKKYRRWRSEKKREGQTDLTVERQR
jgi:hypothetical protein